MLFNHRGSEDGSVCLNTTVAYIAFLLHTFVTLQNYSKSH